MSGGKIKVDQISSREEFEHFARLPYQIYGTREAWWPPDIQSEMDLLAGRALITAYLDLNPFCVWRDGKLVGRVSAVVNHRYNEHWEEKLGQLIHFEALPGEHEAIAALLEHALEWLARRGMNAARSGFAAFLDPCPYTIDNYEQLSSFLLRANRIATTAISRTRRFATEKGQVDYTAGLVPEILDRYREMINAAQRSGVTVKSWREYGFMAAIDVGTDVTNAAFDRHWGLEPGDAPGGSSDAPAARRHARRRPLDDRDTGSGTGRRGLLSAGFERMLAYVRSGARLSPERGGGLARRTDRRRRTSTRCRSRGVARAMAARSFLRWRKPNEVRRLYAGARRQLAVAANRGEPRCARYRQFVTYRRDP